MCVIHLIGRLAAALLPHCKPYTRLSNEVLATAAGRLPGQLQGPATYNPQTRPPYGEPVSHEGAGAAGGLGGG